MASRISKRKEASKPDTPAPASTVAASPQTSLNLLQFLERNSLYFVIALLFLGTVRIVSTYSVFSYTFDEPAHLACGMEWLDKGAYTWEPQHPPLARVAGALGPYLMGIRSQNTPRVDIYSMTYEGIGVLFNNGRYDQAMSLARLGILPFYWVGCLVVYFWARRYASRATAVIALFLFSFLPPILAHAGLATTDMACTAFLAAAFFAGVVWMEEPNAQTGALFGLAAGLAISSKFSVLPYFAVAAVFAFAWFWFGERPKLDLARETGRRIPSLALAGLVAFTIIWAIYRFSFGKVYFANISLPAPELFAGIRDVLKHNAEGHPGYLLGTPSKNGFWYFYLVDIAVKTPLALLVLFFIGAATWRNNALLRRAYLPLAFAAGILAVAMFSHINIGIRHVMPLYAGMCITAAVGVVRLIESAAARRWIGWAAVLLIAWYGGSSLISHPDYLPYFNELAGSHPENIVVDSDLDWGQDMKRLGAKLREVGAQQVYLLPMSLGNLEKQFGFPPVIDNIDALNPSPGWNAVSLTVLKQRRLGMRDRYLNLQPWPDRIEGGELIGKSTRLYYFPPR
jgi:Dolichyl-phosphate-mannose-protein mannosyltransferase